VDPVSEPTRASFAISPWLLLAVLGAAVGAAVLGARDLPDWRSHQDRYAQAQPDFEPALRAAPIGPVAATSADGLEYCSSCHLAGAGYEALDEEPFAAHPDVGHDPLELGCTPCHRGDPGSLAFHEAPAFGRDVPLDGEQAWTACLHCHDALVQAELLAPWPAVAERQALLARLFEDHGCLACHEAGARGGLIGPELTAFGATPVSDPTAAYTGRMEQASMQLEDPAALQPATRMPTPALEPAEREALAVWLSLLGHVVEQDHDAWHPGQPDQLECAGEVFTWLCQPCHGDDGSGRERGRPPGAVPALGSELWLAYTDPELIRHVIEQGRDGSLMEGFHAATGAPILTAAEVDALVDHLRDGVLVQQPDRESYQRVAAGSCEACHPLRDDYLADRDDDQRAAFLAEHPWRWSLEDWLADEGLTLDSCDVKVEDEQGQPMVVHAGEQLYDDLCVHCHQDPQRAPPGEEPSAPMLRGWFEREHHDAGMLLASVVIGRPDAPPTKWRHQGVTTGEYTPTQLACLARWLEANP
jgi:mono/diheme cytochrome c family protein